MADACARGGRPSGRSERDRGCGPSRPAGRRAGGRGPAACVRVVDQVGRLVGIGLQVVQLVPLKEVDRQFVALADRAADGVELAPVVVVDRKAGETDHAAVADGGVGIAQDGRQAGAVQAGRAFDARQVEHGGDQVDVAGQGVADCARRAAGQAHDEGDVGDFLVHHRPLAAQAVRAQHVAVVRGVDDQRVVAVQPLDGLDHAPDLAVDVAVAAEKAGLRGGKVQPVDARRGEARCTCWSWGLPSRGAL